MKKMRKIGLMVLSTVLPLLIIGCFALASTLSFNGFTNTPTKVNIENLTVWHIGSSNTLLDTVLDEMQQLGVAEIKHLEIQESFSNDTSKSMSLKESLVVIFDGNWISKRVDNLELHRFLREATHQRANLIVIGGLTSKFFEALDKAGVNELGRDEAGNVRNPAYYNPLVVGFKLKEASTPDGYPYFYPSIFACNTENVHAIVQQLMNWVGG